MREQILVVECKSDRKKIIFFARKFTKSKTNKLRKEFEFFFVKAPIFSAKLPSRKFVVQKLEFEKKKKMNQQLMSHFSGLVITLLIEQTASFVLQR